MYGKIFDLMYDSTLADDWRALITFQQMIVLCDADGTIDMTPHSISRRTGIPIEHIEEGLKILEAPDPHSRTPDRDGRRIERLDNHRPWGWSIVNHAYYRALQDAESVREQNRIRKQRQREREKAEGGCNDKGVTNRDKCDSHAKSRQTDTDTDSKRGRFTPPTPQVVQQYLDEKGITEFTGERFVNHYESVDWMRGKTKIKSWKHCVGTWQNRNKSSEDNYEDTI